MRPETGTEQAPSPLVSILFHIFSAMHCGAVLLDATKRILRLNDQAQKHLGEALSTTQGRLCATDRGCDALFQTMLDQALKYGGRERDWRREAIGLKRKGRRPVIARVVSVAGEAHNLLEGAGLAVLLVDPEDCPDLSHSLLQQVFGLTKSEARLASHLMCGQCLEEIAAATGVSLGTVRSQIKAVFAKTHTHRQAELVGLLTRLALISEENSAKQHSGSTAHASAPGPD
jgi:DNA-binding CsgD family transcriptional regulator